jgi:hypothetical protein
MASAAPPGWGERALMVLWPSFVMAGVLETLVFALVDPGTLTGFAGEPVVLSSQAVYPIGFLIFCGVIAAAGTLTAMLSRETFTARA